MICITDEDFVFRQGMFQTMRIIASLHLEGRSQPLRRRRSALPERLRVVSVLRDVKMREEGQNAASP